MNTCSLFRNSQISVSRKLGILKEFIHTSHNYYYIFRWNHAVSMYLHLINGLGMSMLYKWTHFTINPFSDVFQLVMSIPFGPLEKFIRKPLYLIIIWHTLTYSIIWCNELPSTIITFKERVGTSRHNCLVSYLLCSWWHISATVGHLQVTKMYIEENYTVWSWHRCILWTCNEISLSIGLYILSQKYLF